MIAIDDCSVKWIAAPPGACAEKFLGTPRSGTSPLRGRGSPDAPPFRSREVPETPPPSFEPVEIAKAVVSLLFAYVFERVYILIYLKIH